MTLHRTLNTLISTPDMWGMPELLELSMQEYRDGQCARRGSCRSTTRAGTSR